MQFVLKSIDFFSLHFVCVISVTVLGQFHQLVRILKLCLISDVSFSDNMFLGLPSHTKIPVLLSQNSIKIYCRQLSDQSKQNDFVETKRQSSFYVYWKRFRANSFWITKKVFFFLLTIAKPTSLFEVQLEAMAVNGQVCGTNCNKILNANMSFFQTSAGKFCKYLSNDTPHKYSFIPINSLNRTTINMFCN